MTVSESFTIKTLIFRLEIMSFISQQSSHDFHQLFAVILAFRDVMVGARFHAPPFVGFFFPERNNDGRDFFQFSVLFEERDQFEPIHPGHFDVRQNQVRLEFARFAEPVQSVDGSSHDAGTHSRPLRHMSTPRFVYAHAASGSSSSSGTLYARL